MNFLGIDAGGTAVRWAVCGRDGALVARGESAPVTGHLFLPEARAGFEAFAGELGAAVADLRIGAAVAGITGLTGDSPEAEAARGLLSEALRLDPTRIEVQDDLWIGYRAVFQPGQGHLVYSGTGSVAMHMREDGSVLRVGGRGILIDDAGSAFAIGRAALNLVYRRIDRGEDPGTLGQALFAAVGGESWNAVRAHVYGGGRTAVALLARAVAGAAEADPAALAVLQEAGAELAVLARALIAREGPRDVVVLGRAAGLHPAILEAMGAALPGVALRMEIADAALAAARLACARASRRRLTPSRSRQIRQEISMDGKRPIVSSVHGMVAAAHPLAASAGARILAMGGNAFDAAAATTAALNVVEPYMSGLAGLGYATCYIAAEQRVRCLNYAPRIPGKFPAGKFAEREEIQRHPLASGTPGNLAGWCELVRAHGKLSLAEVFAPAIALARDGYPIGRFNAELTNLSCVQLANHPQYAELNRVYAFGRGKVAVGDVLKQPDLAATYEAIVKDGPGHLYGGPLGKTMAAYLQSIGGCITEEDLAAVKPVWVDPISVNYRGLTVHSMSPPSEAFQWLLTLRILEGFDLGRMERNGVDHLDTVFRAIRLAAGVRIARNNPNPSELAEILSDAHVAKLRARVADGTPVEGPTEQFVTPQPIDLNKEHTTSLSIADKFGNAVCITQSLGAGFGNGIVIPGTGVCMNNFLYWSEVDTGGRAPLVAGGEIALCVSPSIGTKDGKLVLSIGTPGSYGIMQTQVQALVQYVDFGLDIQDAIAAPRGRLWDGTKIDVEGRIRDEVIAALVRRGHGAVKAPDFTMQVGGMQAVAINPSNGALTGAADPRRDSYAVAP